MRRSVLAKPLPFRCPNNRFLLHSNRHIRHDSPVLVLPLGRQKLRSPQLHQTRLPDLPNPLPHNPLHSSRPQTHPQLLRIPPHAHQINRLHLQLPLLHHLTHKLRSQPPDPGNSQRSRDERQRVGSGCRPGACGGDVLVWA